MFLIAQTHSTSITGLECMHTRQYGRGAFSSSARTELCMIQVLNAVVKELVERSDSHVYGLLNYCIVALELARANE